MIPPESEMLQAAGAVVETLRALSVPYFVGGLLASSMHGEPRLTRDVDIIAAMETRHVASFVRALRPSFYADEPSITNAVRDRRWFNIIHLDTMVKVDVFVAQTDRFTQSQFSRGIEKPLGSSFVANFASAEDTVLAKLRWFRQTGETSDRQWNDILGVLKVQGPAIDLGYLREWAERLQLSDLLAGALEDAGVESD